MATSRTASKRVMFSGARAATTTAAAAPAATAAAPAATTPAAAAPAATTPAVSPSVTSITSTDSLADALNKLVGQFNTTPEYKQRTEAELRERAAGEYQSYYDQLRLAAQQAQDRSVLALNQQRDNLTRNYNDQREAVAEQYRQAYSQADRQLLNRGMQRSTYAGQTLTNLAQKGIEAQQQLWQRQGEDQGQIDAQISQLAQQLGQQLQQYDSSQAADILNRIRELEDQDYERGLANAQYRNTLSSQIYEYLMNNAKFEEDKRQFELNLQLQRMNAIANMGGFSGGGGGGGSSSSSSGGGFAKKPAANAGGAGGTPKPTDDSTNKALDDYAANKGAGIPLNNRSKGGTGGAVKQYVK